MIPVLCLGQTPPEYAELLLQYHVTQTVSDWETAYRLSDAACSEGKRLNVHVKLDTGMTRLGFPWTDTTKRESAEAILRTCELPGLYVDGMYTHFANADGSEPYTKMQLNRFRDAKETLLQRGIRLNLYHCAASSAILKYPCTHMDMIRAGIALYGYPSTENTPGLMPVMTLKSRVAAVRTVSAGTCVSYGCTFKATRDSRIAVLPIGYADGLFRGLSNKMGVMLHGCRCPVVGRICMDMCMVDVTDVPGVSTGDIAIIYGEENLAQADAEHIDTIVYELLTQIAPRVPRIYKSKSSE